METILTVGLYLCLLALLIATYLLYTFYKQNVQLLTRLAEAELITRKSLTDKLDAILRSVDKLNEDLNVSLLKEHKQENRELLGKVTAIHQAVEKVDKTLNETLTLD